MLTPQQLKKKYDKLQTRSKTAFSRAFSKQFNYKTTESLRMMMNGRKSFLRIELEWASDNIEKYELVQIPEIVSEE